MFSLKNLRKCNIFYTPKRNFIATPTTPPGSVIGNRERINIWAKNDVGVLSRILNAFNYNKVNVCQNHSKLLNIEKNGYQEALFSMDVEGSRSDLNLQHALKELNLFSRAVIDDEIPDVPWFPTHLSDLDTIGKLADTTTQDGNKDHPGFKDSEYRDRREFLGQLSFDYKMGNPIPKVAYTSDENKTWGQIWSRLRPLQEKIMCSQFNSNVRKLEEAGIYRQDRIPQLCEVSDFLVKETGWRIKPVSGILSQREFLNALALRVFCSTQYIRHHSVPEYTPEPDIIHELLGHVPMFADKDFADLSQEIGLLSMGNNEENITKLSTLYWYTVEFGVCREANSLKGYGAGVASSIGEIENVGKGEVSGGSQYRPLNPFKDLKTDYPIQTIQPLYYVAESFKDAGDVLVRYGEFLPRPFRAYFNKITNQIEVDRKIKLVQIEEKTHYF